MSSRTAGTRSTGTSIAVCVVASNAASSSATAASTRSAPGGAARGLHPIPVGTGFVSSSFPPAASPERSLGLGAELDYEYGVRFRIRDVDDSQIPTGGRLAQSYPRPLAAGAIF